MVAILAELEEVQVAEARGDELDQVLHGDAEEHGVVEEGVTTLVAVQREDEPSERDRWVAAQQGLPQVWRRAWATDGA